MNKYGLHGSLQAKPGSGQELAAILIRAADLVSTAPGCHIYLISIDPAAPDTVWITEAWDSKELHDDSLKLPDVRALIGEAMPLLAGPPTQGLETVILGGVGISDSQVE